MSPDNSSTTETLKVQNVPEFIVRLDAIKEAGGDVMEEQKKLLFEVNLNILKAEIEGKQKWEHGAKSLEEVEVGLTTYIEVIDEDVEKHKALMAEVADLRSRVDAQPEVVDDNSRQVETSEAGAVESVSENEAVETNKEAAKVKGGDSEKSRTFTEMVDGFGESIADTFNIKGKNRVTKALIRTGGVAMATGLLAMLFAKKTAAKVAGAGVAVGGGLFAGWAAFRKTLSSLLGLNKIFKTSKDAEKAANKARQQAENIGKQLQDKLIQDEAEKQEQERPFELTPEDRDKAVEEYKKYKPEDADERDEVLQIFFAERNAESNLERFLAKMNEDHTVEVIGPNQEFQKVGTALENYNSEMRVVLQEILTMLENKAFWVTAGTAVLYQVGALKLALTGALNASTFTVKNLSKVSTKLLFLGARNPLATMVAGTGLAIGVFVANKASQSLFIPRNLTMLSSALASSNANLYQGNVSQPDQATLNAARAQMASMGAEIADMTSDLGGWARDNFSKLITNSIDIVARTDDESVAIHNGFGVDKLANLLEPRVDNTQSGQEISGKNYELATEGLRSYYRIYMDAYYEGNTNTPEVNNALTTLKTTLKEAGIELEISGEIISWKEERRDQFDLMVHPKVTDKVKIKELSERMAVSNDALTRTMYAAGNEILVQINKMIESGEIDEESSAGYVFIRGSFAYIFNNAGEYIEINKDLVTGILNEEERQYYPVTVGKAAIVTTITTVSVRAMARLTNYLSGGVNITRAGKWRVFSHLPGLNVATNVNDIKNSVTNVVNAARFGPGNLHIMSTAGIKPNWIAIVEHGSIDDLKKLASSLGSGEVTGTKAEIQTLLKNNLIQRIKDHSKGINWSKVRSGKLWELFRKEGFVDPGNIYKNLAGKTKVPTIVTHTATSNAATVRPIQPPAEGAHLSTRTNNATRISDPVFDDARPFANSRPSTTTPEPAAVRPNPAADDITRSTATIDDAVRPASSVRGSAPSSITAEDFDGPGPRQTARPSTPEAPGVRPNTPETVVRPSITPEAPPSSVVSAADEAAETLTKNGAKMLDKLDELDNVDDMMRYFTSNINELAMTGDDAAKALQKIANKLPGTFEGMGQFKKVASLDAVQAIKIAYPESMLDDIIRSANRAKIARNAFAGGTLGAVIGGVIIYLNHLEYKQAIKDGDVVKQQLLNAKHQTYVASTVGEVGLGASMATGIVTGPIGWIGMGAMAVGGIGAEVLYAYADYYNESEADYKKKDTKELLYQLRHGSSLKNETALVAYLERTTRAPYTKALLKNEIVEILRNQIESGMYEKEIEKRMRSRRATMSDAKNVTDEQLRASVIEALKIERVEEQFEKKIDERIKENISYVAGQKRTFLKKLAKSRGGLHKLKAADLQMADIYGEFKMAEMVANKTGNGENFTKNHLKRIKQKYKERDIELTIPDSLNEGEALYENYESSWKRGDLAWAYKVQELEQVATRYNFLSNVSIANEEGSAVVEMPNADEFLVDSIKKEFFSHHIAMLEPRGGALNMQRYVYEAFQSYVGYKVREKMPYYLKQVATAKNSDGKMYAITSMLQELDIIMKQYPKAKRWDRSFTDQISTSSSSPYYSKTWMALQRTKDSIENNKAYRHSQTTYGQPKI